MMLRSDSHLIDMDTLEAKPARRASNDTMEVAISLLHQLSKTACNRSELDATVVARAEYQSASIKSRSQHKNHGSRLEQEVKAIIPQQWSEPNPENITSSPEV